MMRENFSKGDQKTLRRKQNSIWSWNRKKDSEAHFICTTENDFAIIWRIECEIKS